MAFFSRNTHSVTHTLRNFDKFALLSIGNVLFSPILFSNMFGLDIAKFDIYLVCTHLDYLSVTYKCFI